MAEEIRGYGMQACLLCCQSILVRL